MDAPTDILRKQRKANMSDRPRVALALTAVLDEADRLEAELAEMDRMAEQYDDAIVTLSKASAAKREEAEAEALKPSELTPGV